MWERYDGESDGSPRMGAISTASMAMGVCAWGGGMNNFPTKNATVPSCKTVSSEEGGV